jgi:hypothetical protein
MYINTMDSNVRGTILFYRVWRVFRRIDRGMPRLLHGKIQKVQRDM